MFATSCQRTHTEIIKHTLNKNNTMNMVPPPQQPLRLGRMGVGQVSCLNSRHLSCLNSRHQHQHSLLSISIQNQQSAYHAGCDSSRLDSEIPGRYITLGSRVMMSKGYVSGLAIRLLFAVRACLARGYFIRASQRGVVRLSSFVSQVVEPIRRWAWMGWVGSHQGT